MAGTTTRLRRGAKPTGAKSANRYAKFAGGDAASDIDLSPAADEAGSTGLIAGMAALAADEAHRIVEARVSEIAPHPFNDAERNEPQPGDPKWEELRNSIAAHGVRLPMLAVTRESFAAARPIVAEGIPADARYVLVYGHRRRAAALEAGRETVPVIVDDSVMEGDGDIDDMAAENLGRKDLSDIAEGALYARYSDMGLSQQQIADRLGVHQGTVSRKLALNLLAPEICEAVNNGTLPSAEAAALAGKLPYGPLRRWQKTKDRDQDSDRRRAEQIEAQRLVLEQNWSASRAAERVIGEREARAEAAALGVALVDDPRSELGDSYLDHRISRGEYHAGDDVIGAININTGQLDLYRRHAPADADDTAVQPSAGSQQERPAAPAEVPTQPASKDAGKAANNDADAGERSGESTGEHGGEHDNPVDDTDDIDVEVAAIADQKRADAAAAAAAQKRRRESCAALITHQPSNAELLKILVRQYLSGVAARCQTSAVNALLRDWDASADGVGDKARNARAFHRAVAAAELHTAELKDKAWDEDACSHVELLIERVGYEPTDWETAQLNAVPR